MNTISLNHTMTKLKLIFCNDNFLITAKMLTYRVLGSTTTFLFIWGVTGKATESGAATLAIGIVRMVEYWLHEKLWRWLEHKITA